PDVMLLSFDRTRCQPRSSRSRYHFSLLHPGMGAVTGRSGRVEKQLSGRRQRARGGAPQGAPPRLEYARYLRLAAAELNSDAIFGPRANSATMTAIAMAAMIRAYSTMPCPRSRSSSRACRLISRAKRCSMSFSYEVDGWI